MNKRVKHSLLLTIVGLFLATSVWGQPIPASEYNKYPIGSGNSAAEITWTTIGNDVVITISAVEGSEDPSATRFRDQIQANHKGNGMCDAGLGKFKVGGADATTYFEKDFTSGNVYTLKLKDGIEAPAIGTKITHAEAVEYQTESNDDCWPSPTFSYSYGYKNAILAKPTNIAISEGKQITFDAVDGATSYKAFVYGLGEYCHEQEVASGDVLNFSPRIASTYQVYVQAYGTDDAFSPASDAYDWVISTGTPGGYAPITTIKDYPIQDGNNAESKVLITMSTNLENGDIEVTIAPQEGGDPDYTYWVEDGMRIGGFWINGANTFSSYFDAGYTGNVPAGTTKLIYHPKTTGENIPQYGDIIQFKINYIIWRYAETPDHVYPNNIVLPEFIYGTNTDVNNDHVSPIVEISEISSTINSATLQIDVTEKNDAGDDCTLRSLTIRDDINGYAEEDVVLNGENQVTLSGLEYNTTYHFTVKAEDLGGNVTEETIDVVLPFNTALNLSLGRGDYCTAGATQGANTPNKAVNGSSDFWTSYDTGDAPSWWQVDLGTAYDVSRVVITFNDIAAAYNIEASINGTDWTTIVEGATASFGNTRTYSDLTMSAQYFKVTCPTSTRIGIKEFEVYATGFSVADDTDPTVAVTCPAKTVTSATLQIIAADKDDAGNAGTITSIKITGDNGFVEQEVLGSLVENQITLSGLKNNKTYHFTVTATDMAGNTGNDAIEVVLPFDTEYNIALDGTASAGFSESTAHGAAKANDGDAEDANSQWNSYGVDNSVGGYANNWWQVQLDAEYNLSTIKIVSKEAHHNQYVLEGSLDGSHYYKLAEGVISAVGTDEKTVAAPAQYMRFSCSNNFCSIYEFKVYASGFSTLTDSKPVVTYAKVGEVTDATAEIEIDAVDITTMPITTYMVSGLGGDPVEVTASVGKINLTSLSQSTNYSISIQAKDGNGNLSDAKVLAFTTAGGVSGLYVYSGYFGPWEEATKTLPQARFSTTAEAGVMRLAISNMTAGNHLYKLYNADADRCTFNACGAGSDHYIVVESARDVYFYATDEDHFVCTADNLYLRGTLVGEDKALVWNDAHTKATWSGTVDLSGTKQYTLVKNNGSSFIYDHDIYDAAQTYDGELTDVTFTFDATKMTGTWSEHAYPVTLDETIDNSTTISNNNGRLADVTLARGFVADGGNYTLCLPFNMTAEQCAEAFHDGYQLWYLEDSRLKDNGDIYLNFISADNIVAGRPYLFCPASDVASGTVIENVRINSSASKESNSTYANFVGTYDKIPQATLSANNKAYLLGEENWLFSAENLRYDMKALRAYFELNPDIVNNVHPRMRVVFNEPRTDMPTDIEEVEQVTAPAKRIVNGQLIIEKNGVLYNAQGKRLQ